MPPVSQDHCAKHAATQTDGNTGRPQDEILVDPTMAECCRRDALHRAHVGKVKAELRAVDPSMRALDVKSEVFRILPEEEEEEVVVRKSEDEGTVEEEEEGSDDDDDAAFLKRLRNQRVNELRSSMQTSSTMVNGNLGHVQTIGEAALLSIVQLSKEACVLHLHHSTSKESNHAKHLFNGLSHEYKQTRFLRMHIEDSKAHHSFQGVKLIQGPSIACFAKGSLAKQISLTTFVHHGNFLEEKVIAFLKSLCMLHMNEESDASVSSEDDNEDPWMEAPCVMCGRRYPHKHYPATPYSLNITSSGSDLE